MSRYAKDNRNRQYAPPVEKIELSEKHLWPRLAIAVVLLLAGVGALAVGFNQFISTGDGWQEISVESNSEVNCSEEFTVWYNLGTAGVSAGTENRAISSIFTECCATGYQTFTNDQSFDGVVNLFDINSSPNEILTVSDLLYSALEKLDESGLRDLYLGPLVEELENLTTCENDAEAKQFDPLYSEDYAEEFAAVIGFINDPDSIQLELLGNDQVRLNISDEYLAYAEENGITAFLDFWRMRNAFIIDLIAEEMIDAGYTHGILSSYDGYTRILDGGDSTFSYYDSEDGTAVLAASLNTTGVTAVAAMRNFPLADMDADRYFTYSDGQIRTPYLSTEDGLCHSAVSALTGLSAGGTCTDLMLAMTSVYVSDDPIADGVDALLADGIYTLYAEEETLYSNLPSEYGTVTPAEPYSMAD